MAEIEYILNDNERLILLLRAEINEDDREKHLDELSKNQEELRRLYGRSHGD